jgi:hypothetical protein
MAPRYLIDAPYIPGVSPSLVARRTLLIIIGQAAAEGFADKPYSLHKDEIRREHRGSESIRDLVEDMLGIHMALPGKSHHGQQALNIFNIFERITIEDAETGHVDFHFTRWLLKLFGGNDAYGSLKRAALFSFTGKYAVTLYQLGALYARRDYPEVKLSASELRDRLGVPEGKYGKFTEIRRYVIQPAIAEVNQLADFDVSFEEHRRGNRIEAVTFRFDLKDEARAEIAAREVKRHKAGRKARRDGSVEQVTASVAADDQKRALDWLLDQPLSVRNIWAARAQIAGHRGASPNDIHSWIHLVANQILKEIS